jgi:bis(5'-nucleosyl)-tetraphosphatase (symmetrical)
MSTWAVGDIQGCFEPLQHLLSEIDYRAERDRLILLGDLVNRGPQSLEVLRWARAQGDLLVSLLGNHDLHLLAVAKGLRSLSEGDTLQPVLDAPDRDDLLRWLLHRPLLHREGAHTFVHAAIHPSWSLEMAQSHSEGLQRALGGPDAGELLMRYQRPPPAHPHQALAAEDELALALAVFTRLRCVTASGEMSFDFTGTLEDLPADRVPWWRARRDQGSGEVIVFGHWAAIGVHREEGLLALDSGCVWGRKLSAYCLDDGRIVQVAGLSQR